jgi:uncharacterized protein
LAAQTSKPRVAIVGTGVAGLGCAWHLKDSAALTLFEKNTRTGGHTNTVSVNEDGRQVPIDTGFIVFNHVTYPNLCRLFDELGVRTKPSEMSFSVQHLPSGLEYNGMSLNKVFAQRRNLLNPQFYRLLSDIFRFFRVANASLESGAKGTVAEFAETHHLGGDFLDYYLVPMSSAVWSTDSRDILNFPAETLIRFFHNHGFLGVSTHHPWFTVDGGARTYVQKIVRQVGEPRLGAAVCRIERVGAMVRVCCEDGSREEFDAVVLACHADEALEILSAPTSLQSRLLAPFRYQPNHATLHTWAGVMPRKRRAWASWNYRVDGVSSCPTTHYFMNALQGVSHTRDYFVSLNSADIIPEEHVLYQTEYTHPVFTLEAMRAQEELPGINSESRDQNIFFCGSYFKYGFHEDAYSAGLYLAMYLRERLATP